MINLLPVQKNPGATVSGQCLCYWNNLWFTLMEMSPILWPDYKDSGMILLRSLKAARGLIVVKTCLWVFEISPVMISTH